MNYLGAILCCVFGLLKADAQGISVRGKVFEDSNKNKVYDLGEPLLSGVLLSNGRDLVATNAQGEYQIELIPDLSVFIIKPSGFQSPLSKNNKVEFFIPLKQNDAEEIYDFPLYKQEENKRSDFVLLGDLQVDVMDDINHVEKLVVEELAKDPPDLIFPLGDLVFDNLEIFEPLAQSLGLIGAPIYYVAGNHDLNFGREKLEQRDDSFKRVFGPSYYALEYGEQLIVVLNNIIPISDKEYVGGIDVMQKVFLNKILQEFKHRKITVMMHIPVEFMEDKNDFLELFAEYPEVFIATGHTHTQYHKYFERKNNPAIHQLVAGAVCGAWWQGPHDIEGIPFAMMYDGTWKGYWHLYTDAGKQQLQYKVSGRSESKQMSIWSPEYKDWDQSLHHLNDQYIYVNVFAADQNTQVEISFDDGPWSAMHYFEGVDPAYKRLIALQDQGRYNNGKTSSMVDAKRISTHLWRFPVPFKNHNSPGIAKIRAIAKNLGLNHVETRVFRAL
ncbi:calcineurin-like phosphoesterase family protein [Flavobacterium sp. HSC-61S13]|uniref:calcineurin-like phosphoesterase C-terminal domain-containing protein n=1 Tax=Flavobacterium sp. HSC-61S13 TaxID=2910963 RepID=UPI00209D6FD4|nr:calcineurin-like phosphoesterase family protein [Flavobacterium sp. HSC-61S13]MCP1996381.1 putative phosphodiesterase [Flavobacterium sp. HSC-61S13]